MKKIEVFTTSDGKFFINQEDAELHEQDLKIENEVLEYFKTDFYPHRYQKTNYTKLIIKNIVAWEKFKEQSK